MRLQTIILFLSLLLLSSVVSAQKVDITNLSIRKIDDNVLISFDANIDKLSTNYKLTLTPVLCNGDKEQKLLPIVVVGRNKAIIQKRKGETKIEAIIGRPDGSISYETTITFEKWMAGVSLRMDRMLKGCCDSEILPSISIAQNRLIPSLLPIAPIFNSDVKAAYLAKFRPIINHYPFVSLSGETADEDGLILHFQQGSAVIKLSHVDNKNSLDDIIEAIELIQSEPNIELTKIAIVGGASPEGAFIYNQKLGQRRVDALVSYLSQYVSNDIFSTKNLGENWSGLYTMVERSDMEYKDEVLYIIDNYEIGKGREKKLIALDGGNTYGYMLREFFPELRMVSYLRVFYDIKPDAEYRKIEEASILLKAEDYTTALELLQTVISPTSYTNNLIGVCYMMMGDAMNARIYFQKAIDGGDSDAKENLERLDYQSNNIQYK